MSKLELQKTKLELQRVACARAEMEYNIMQREDEIQRLQDNIKIQTAKELELKQKIEESSTQS